MTLPNILMTIIYLGSTQIELWIHMIDFMINTLKLTIMKISPSSQELIIITRTGKETSSMTLSMMWAFTRREKEAISLSTGKITTMMLMMSIILMEVKPNTTVMTMKISILTWVTLNRLVNTTWMILIMTQDKLKLPMKRDQDQAIFKPLIGLNIRQKKIHKGREES